MTYREFLRNQIDKTPMESGLQANGDLVLEDSGIKLIMPKQIIRAPWYEEAFIIEINDERDFDCIDCMDYYKGENRTIRDYEAFCRTQRIFGGHSAFERMVKKSGWLDNLDEFNRIFMKLQREIYRQANEIRKAEGIDEYTPFESVGNDKEVEKEIDKRFERCFHFSKAEFDEELYEKAFAKDKLAPCPVEKGKAEIFQLDVDPEAFEYDDFYYEPWKIERKAEEFLIENYPELRGEIRDIMNCRAKKYQQLKFVAEEREYPNGWRLIVKCLKNK